MLSSSLASICRGRAIADYHGINAASSSSGFDSFCRGRGVISFWSKYFTLTIYPQGKNMYPIEKFVDSDYNLQTL